MRSLSGLDSKPVKRKYESDDSDNEGPAQKRPIKSTSNDESDDNASSDEEECESEEIYDASDEPFPIHAAFDPGLKHITATASKLVQEAHSNLKKHASKSTTLQNMQKNVEETPVPPKAEPPKIAFVGPTGEGKSSAGNAILGVKGLMRTGSAGSSITNVATIYQWSFPHQKLKYAAIISYRSLADCRIVLEDLLTCYKQNSLEAEEKCDKERKSTYEMHSQEAIKIFVGLFRGRAGFRDRTEAEKTLDEQVGSDGALLVERMLAWCQEFLATLDQKDGVFSIYVEADNPTDLDNAIRPFTADSPKNSGLARWPLVQEVRVGTSESRFLEYANLVDLPGQSDTNPIRSRTADDHIRRCQGLYVFADIKRAVTDPSLHRTVSLYAERFPSTLVIVITKIDQGVDTGLLNTMRDEGHDMAEYDRLSSEISRLRSETKKATKKASTPGRKPAEDRVRLYDRIQELGKELTDAENKQFGELIGARNRHTTQGLLQDKQHYFEPGGHLRVVHISPEHYEVHKSSARRRCPLMDVTLTGIPELRDIALMMAGPPLWKAQTEYLESQVSVFIHGLRLWSAGCAVRDRSELLSIVAGLTRDEADSPLNGLSSQRDTIIERKLLRSLRTFRKEAREGALDQLKGLDKWNPRSWISFYRHFGQHTTDSKGATSWNEMFLQRQTHDKLDPCWHEMVPVLQETFCEARKQVSVSIESTKKKLMLSPASVSLDKTVIEGLFKGFSNGLQSNFDRVIESCKQSILGIKMDATKDRHNSFFTIAMNSAYEVGLSDKGNGVTKRCKQHLRKHLSLPLHDPREPFAVHNGALAKALKDDSRKHTQDLQIYVRTRSSEIYRQFQLITEQKPETPTEASARKAIKPFLYRALRGIGHIENVLEQIRLKYPCC